MNNAILNRGFAVNKHTNTEQESITLRFVLSSIESARIALRWGYALGTTFMLCVSSAYAADKQQDISSDTATLPIIKVKAEQDQTHTKGQLASKSHLGFLGDKSVLDTPFNTVAYTDQYVQNIQAQNITDIIAKTDPTVFTNNASGGWSENYYIRGFSSSTKDMSMNGMYGITPYYRTSPEMFERVEVLKGPSALLNGMPPSGSVGGTVNLVTKRATDTPVTRLTTTYMSDSQVGGHLDVGRRFGENNAFGARLNATYRDGAAAVDNQDKKATGLALGLDWKGERARLSADLYSAQDRVDGVNRGISVATGIAVPTAPKVTTQLSPSWGYATTKDKGFIVRGEYDLTDAVMAYATYGQSDSEYTYNGAIGGTIIDNAGNYNTTVAQLAFEAKKKSADVGLKGHFQTGEVGHQWVANVTYHHQNYEEYGRRAVGVITNNIYHPVWTGTDVALQTLPAITKTGLEQISYGLADTLSFADDKLQLTLGMRHQQIVSETFNATTKVRTKRDKDSATSPGAAILYKLSDHVSVYGNYIEGFSMTTAPNTATNSGEFFGPYKTKQQELGVKWDLGTFTNTLSIFNIQQPNSYLNTANVFSVDGEQRNRGIEWGFFGSPLENVRLMGGFAYVDPKLTKTTNGVNQGKVATGVAKNQAKLGVEWDTPVVSGLTLTANATAVSKQYISADNTLSVAGHTLYDVGARYTTQIATHPVTLRGAVNNLTNKAYWGMPQISNLALGAPRTYLLSVAVDF
ncbi:TonB-dependent siderophore receptor [Acinetobacter sp. MD2]|uniref:TonB-dependent receptor n=1 Tax=Acinetobacter sp. MD2 TaxID=2600066 RepID=UPI002D1F07FC|nr:TonB-dependent siderophore receptor [Acinetobacter sp. MD2]MEB3766355.1 TonB-dependent siderophore receptor [Acinetobacter sp. MD2]